MKTNWRHLVARIQAQNPSWTWSQCCAEVGRRGKRHAAKPSPQQFVRKMEQMKLW